MVPEARSFQHWSLCESSFPNQANSDSLCVSFSTVGCSGSWGRSGQGNERDLIISAAVHSADILPQLLCCSDKCPPPAHAAGNKFNSHHSPSSRERPQVPLSPRLQESVLHWDLHLGQDPDVIGTDIPEAAGNGPAPLSPHTLPSAELLAPSDSCMLLGFTCLAFMLHPRLPSVALVLCSHTANTLKS